jgi:hypothetical protein
MMNPQLYGTEIQIEVFKQWIDAVLATKVAAACPNCGCPVHGYDVECVDTTPHGVRKQHHPGRTWLQPCRCWVRRLIQPIDLVLGFIA